MRYAIIADVHGNLDALEAVLSDIEKQEVDSTFCIGDIVGYGAEPEACVKGVTSAASVVLLGNHDAAAAGRLSLELFNVFAREALVWTAGVLPAADLKYLEKLPLVAEGEGFTLVHSSLYGPERFPYLVSPLQARLCFEVMEKQVCFVAHSHVPLTFIEKGKQLAVTRTEKLALKEGSRYIVNVGSVGQPRDGDSRAAYGVYDSEAGSVEIRRVGYDLVRAAEKIRKAGLPELLADRLFEGA